MSSATTGRSRYAAAPQDPASAPMGRPSIRDEYACGSDGAAPWCRVDRVEQQDRAAGPGDEILQHGGDPGQHVGQRGALGDPFEQLGLTAEQRERVVVVQPGAGVRPRAHPGSSR
ncbi:MULTISPECIES: hypothetical protein [unclassified Pseudonocardia]|uniref:hypothetical protein n=1 Tax=unclassified Pseudonocardia TaxID=2619320 RepID=UPI0020169C40|nr:MULTISPECIES: hypothetical protein [unclassified Pseudonocardia]